MTQLSPATVAADVGRRIPMFSVRVDEGAIPRVVETLRSGWLGEGPRVAEFEALLGRTLGIPFPVAVNSGTAALHLALVLAGVRAGDEVITTAQTMMATSHVVLAQQATPVFADVQYRTGNIDPRDLAHRLTSRTRAILVVHWAGYPCDMDAIHDVARSHGIPVIEDAAHALGATYKGVPIGGISPFTAFSFQATKHVTAGDGGALCVTSEGLWESARRRRWFGIDRGRRRPARAGGEREWEVSEVGFKYHMNDIAASVGIENLRPLARVLQRRAAIAAIYRSELGTVPGVTLFESAADRTSAFWVFSVHVEDRDSFARHMASRGVEVSVVHTRIDRHPVFGGERADLPGLDAFTRTHIALPLHDQLTDEDVAFVCDGVRAGW